MKRSRVDRMVQIFMALQSGHNNRVAEPSEAHDAGRRTIFRSLKGLKEIGALCYCDANAGVYSIDPSFFLPSINLNHKEAMVLLLTVHGARTRIKLPFKRAILLAVTNLESNLPSEITRPCNTGLRRISIEAGPEAKTDLLNKVFAQLLEAVLRKRIVNGRYYLPREQKSVVVDLSPYHLFYCDITWHVPGNSGLNKGVGAFRLSRIKELNMLDKCFVDNDEFDVQQYLGRAWSMIPEGRRYHVRLRFLPEVARDVALVQWHSTQTVTFEGDGSAIVEFRVDGLNEITWWILGYGDRVQVFAPRILRQKIIEIAQKTLRANE